MIGHYLRSALATFSRAPVAAAANVVTLALGLACFVAAWGIATYWRSADSHHPGADRIVYVAQAAFGGGFSTISSSSLPIALRTELPELEAVAQFQGARQSSMNQASYSSGDRDAFLTSGLADASLFDVFGFEFVEGGRDTAFKALNDIVITEPAARRLFGDEPALGRSVSFMGLMDFTVSAVIAPVRQPSFMGHSAESPVSFDVLQNIASRMPESQAAWTRLFGMTAVRLPPSMAIEDFQARLDDLATRTPPNLDIRFEARPIADLTTQLVNARLLSQERGAAGFSAGAILLGLGALILVVACINAANLAAAQAGSRVKETGMRKVLGGGRRALLAQHLAEAGLLTGVAIVLALAVVALAQPVFQRILGADVTHFLRADPGGVVFLTAITLAAATAIAIYPAFVLSKVRAADALGGVARRTHGMIRVLVAIQFLSASFLSIVVTVTQLQQAHLRAQFGDVALQGDVVVYLDWIPGVTDLSEIAGDGSRESDFDVFASQVLAAPQVRSVTAIDALPLIDPSGNFGAYATTPDAAEYSTVQEKNVGADFVRTMGVRLIAGRALDPRDRTAFAGAPSATPRSVMIDRRLAESLGYENPAEAVGRTLYAPGGAPDAGPAPGRAAAMIVGVVESDTSRLTADIGSMGRIAGAAYRLDMDYVGAQFPALRVDGDDIPGALAAIQSAWDLLQPDQALRVRFADDLFDEGYAAFRKVASAFVALSLAALLIATTGILGMAAHVAARRTREIGVRKTLGASTVRVLGMLLADFSRPVIVGNLLAWPFAWAAAQIYLQPFAERAPLTPLPFIVSLAFTLLIAWLSVGGQAWKAASVRPALVLRAE